MVPWIEHSIMFAVKKLIIKVLDLKMSIFYGGATTHFNKFLLFLLK